MATRRMVQVPRVEPIVGAESLDTDNTVCAGGKGLPAYSFRDTEALCRFWRTREGHVAVRGKKTVQATSHQSASSLSSESAAEWRRPSRLLDKMPGEERKNRSGAEAILHEFPSDVLSLNAAAVARSPSRSNAQKAGVETVVAAPPFW